MRLGHEYWKLDRETSRKSTAEKNPDFVSVEECNTELQTWSSLGRFYLRGYRGNSGKPYIYYTYKTAEARDAEFTREKAAAVQSWTFKVSEKARKSANGRGITLATFKKFVRENEGRLLIRTSSYFDGMIDGRTHVKNPAFSPATPTAGRDEHGLGYAEIHLVLGSRDYFTAFDEGEYTGIGVSNCCGSFTVAVAKFVEKVA